MGTDLSCPLKKRYRRRCVVVICWPRRVGAVVVEADEPEVDEPVEVQWEGPS